MRGEFITTSGERAFGGVESTCLEFAPNKNVRSDGEIVKGEYEYFAYHTDYSNWLIEDAIKSEIGNSGLGRIGKVALFGWGSVSLGLVFIGF